MKWLVILYLIVLAGLICIYVRALFRFIKVKEFFWNSLPERDKDCINGFPNGLPRYPISDYYKKHPLPWAKETVDELLKRNETLSKCDKEKAEQLFLSEKQMFYSLNTAIVATAIFAFTYVMMNMSRDM